MLGYSLLHLETTETKTNLLSGVPYRYKYSLVLLSQLILTRFLISVNTRSFSYLNQYSLVPLSQSILTRSPISINKHSFFYLNQYSLVLLSQSILSHSFSYLNQYSLVLQFQLILTRSPISINTHSFSYFNQYSLVPLSQSNLPQVECPGQCLEHRPPQPPSTSAGQTVYQTGYCRVLWHSGSTPAEARTLRSPKGGNKSLNIIVLR